MEFPAFLLFSLYYIEFLLKARGKLRPEWTAKLLDDGSLAVRDKVYSVPHFAILLLRKIKGKAFEYEVVLVVLMFQAVFCAGCAIFFLQDVRLTAEASCTGCWQEKLLLR